MENLREVKIHTPHPAWRPAQKFGIVGTTCTIIVILGVIMTIIYIKCKFFKNVPVAANMLAALQGPSQMSPVRPSRSSETRIVFLPHDEDIPHYMTH